MNAKYLFLITILSVISSSAIYAQNFYVYGTVRDLDNGELLSDVSVTSVGSNTGSVSNSYGFYSLRLPLGEYQISWSCMGYQRELQAIRLTEDISLDITLKQAELMLDEVLVQGQHKKNDMNVTRLKMTEIRSMPAALSEPDVLRGLQTLPGIQVSHQGSTNMSIRGGAYSHNLVLLDEAPVYHPSHILGFISSFNPDAVSSVNLYKTVPPRYGKMLSSVIDVRMKEGNREHFSTSGGIGLISGRLLFEGPFPDNKGSFLLAGRYCYAGFTLRNVSDLLYELKVIRDDRINSKTNLWFYDLNLKSNYTINSKNRIFLSGYSGFDKFFYPDFSGEYMLEWGNMNGTLRWNHIVNPALFVNTSLIASRFHYSHFQLNRGLNYLWDASLGNIELKSNAEYTASDALKVNFGISLTDYKFHPGNINPRASADLTAGSFSLENKQSLESSVFVETDWVPVPNLLVNAGVRFSAFSNFGPGTEYMFDPINYRPVDSTVYKKNRLMHNFSNLIPSAGITYSFDASTVHVSFAQTVQYLHKASNSTLGMPTDIWFPANRTAAPQLAHQFSIGYSYAWGKSFTVSVEPYFKRMYRQVDFRDNADLFVNPYLESEIRSGDGHSKGIELMIEKMQGNFIGRMSYTLSDTKFKIVGINNNQEYPAPYDSRHNLSAFFACTFFNKLTFSSSFKYASGRPVTIPSGMFNYQGSTFLIYSERNGHRIEDFHQLDVSINYMPKQKKKKYQGSWNFSILNIYNRKNVFSILLKPDEIYNSADPYGNDPNPVKKMYLYGILPSIGYDFKF